jgi:hypothetical protein
LFRRGNWNSGHETVISKKAPTRRTPFCGILAINEKTIVLKFKNTTRATSAHSAFKFVEIREKRRGKLV